MTTQFGGGGSPDHNDPAPWPPAVEDRYASLRRRRDRDRGETAGAWAFDVCTELPRRPVTLRPPRDIDPATAAQIYRRGITDVPLPDDDITDTRKEAPAMTTDLTAATWKAGEYSDAVDAVVAEQARIRAAAEHSRSVDAVLHQSPTTTPSFPDETPTGSVPGLRPNPGMLRALLQPVLFLKLEEPVGAFEVGDVVAAQFWGEGRVMLTPLPMAASRGRIPTTFPANKIHAVIDGPVDRATDPAHNPAV